MPSKNAELPTQLNTNQEAHLSLNLQAHSRLELLLAIQESIYTQQELTTTCQLALQRLLVEIPNCQAGCVIQFGAGQEQPQALAFNLSGRETPWPVDLASSQLVLEKALDPFPSDLVYQNLLLDDPQQTESIQSYLRDQGLRACLAIGLRVDDRLVGSLLLASAFPGPFNPTVLQIAKEVGRALSLGMGQMFRLENEGHHRREVDVLRDVMVSLASSVSLSQALEVILRNLGLVVRYDRAALYMQNENSQFQFPTGLGQQEPDSSAPGAPRIFPLDDPIIAELRRLKQPLVVNDIQRDERFQNWPERELVHAWMGVPLFMGEEIVGIVSLGDLEPGAYSAEDAGLVQMFTNQVAEVLWRARDRDHPEMHSEELELITTFSFALQYAKSQENILAVIMDQTSQVFGANQGTFLKLEKDGSTLVVDFSQNVPLIGKWHAHGGDPLWQVVRTQVPIFITDTSTCLEQYQGSIYSQLFQQMRSAALLPLHTPETIFGVLCFTFRERQVFSQEDQRLFQAICAIAGTALRRAIVLESLEKQINTRTRHLSALYEISAASAEPVEVEELLAHLMVLTLDVLNTPAGAIHLLDNAKKTLRLAAQVGLPQQIRANFSTLPVTTAFWRNILRSDEPVILSDIGKDRRTPQELAGNPYPTFLAVPIRAKGESLGLFSLMSESVLEYTIEDITLFTTIAEQVGSAVERARLQRQAERAAVAEERQRLARELHDSISQLLYSLVLYAGAGRKVLGQGDLGHTEEYLQRMDQTSLQALKEMRLLVYELRPSVFREEGLVGALNRRLQAVEKRTGMHVQLIVVGDIALDDTVELTLYRIAEEALNNTLKHSQATEVSIRIAAEAGQVDLEIHDNGCGFDLQNVTKAGGLGLVGIRERVSQLGGELDIRTAPDQGALIHVHLEVGDE